MASKIGELLSGGDGKENAAALDGFMQSQVNPLASNIIKLCLPDGLAVPFPENVSNMLSCLMTSMVLLCRLLFSVSLM